MAKKSVKSQVTQEVKFAKHWTKEYVESVFQCIEEGNLEEAIYYASQLAPVWGAIESTLQEIIEQDQQD